MVRQHMQPPAPSRSSGTAASSSTTATAGIGESSLPLIKVPLLLVSDLDDTLIPGAHSQLATDQHTAQLRDLLHASRAEGRVRLGASVLRMLRSAC